jgi:hypothetical protein
MTDRAITGVLALCPGRAAAATLEQVLAQPDLANDLIVIVGDSSRQRDKRATYRAIFSTLGRVRRPVLWVPEYTESAFEREVGRAYGSAQPPPASRSARGLLVMRGARPSDLGSPVDELVGELLRTFRPRLAPRIERPAVYAVRDQGSRGWLEL